MKETIVLYPSPGMGHIVSMVELGKLFVHHGFNVTILLIPPPHPFIASVSASNPSITFHHLPMIDLSPDSVPSHYHEPYQFELIRLHTPNLAHALRSIITSSSSIRAFIADFFCSTSLDVAAELNIPFYFFFTTGASVLATFLYFPTIHESITTSFRELGEFPLYIPGLPPLRAIDMPLPILDRHDPAYDAFLNISHSLPKAKGIILNSFESLEPRSLKAISDGLCMPHAAPPVPVHCIGPLIMSEGRGGGGDDDDVDCLKWLDAQPEKSVVFLCFGSLGLFSAEQLREIAVGLDRSGHKFLWVVRSPPLTEEQNKLVSATPEPDLDALLPPGFQERTKDRGLVVKSWAPQAAVLSHGSVGGFVTHCGWNSVLEAVCGGVPMVAWPLYAEQRLNRVFLVGELKLAIPIDDGFDKGVVSAAEVERRVRELMSNDDDGLRERVLRAKYESVKAMREGGSSNSVLIELVNAWKK
ncbi:Anthocyanidin 5,3-O-glucosyltransferase [Acorus gramineus]|uniref:Glycosyltransferase n=1 Tax=Acorus gramineus TaxID=55184 RepID=A0AAV9B032_ACOGR|nr:Anthocyanidin 5,3-O-glucosyltransferase [Acorus gramineus]